MDFSYWSLTYQDTRRFSSLKFFCRYEWYYAQWLPVSRIWNSAVLHFYPHWPVSQDTILCPLKCHWKEIRNDLHSIVAIIFDTNLLLKMCLMCKSIQDLWIYGCKKNSTHLFNTTLRFLPPAIAFSEMLYFNNFAQVPLGSGTQSRGISSARFLICRSDPCAMKIRHMWAFPWRQAMWLEGEKIF